jgi:hypothetical protein
MEEQSRREFLAQVGQGMLIAGVGSALAADLGLASLRADGPEPALTFGKLEPLVDLMQQTPAAKLLPLLVDKVKEGTQLRTLVTAGALANARTFGGHDYTGYHAFMALVPSFEMARAMPAARQALPVLKVLYRNTARIQALGGRKKEALRPVEPAPLPRGRPGGEVLREATRKCDLAGAERTLAALTRGGLAEAFNDLQLPVQDDVDVHRVVLAWRAWSTLDLTGKEHAHTLLRQSVRYCVDSERHYLARKTTPGIRAVLPKLLERHKLLEREPGRRRAEDGWVEKLSRTVLTSSRDRGAEAVAAALGEGMAPEDVGEAISLAATQLVLRDPGRPKAYAADKPVGSVHGDSVGVHASDAANAWRDISRVSNRRNMLASLVVAAYHTAGQLPDAGRKPYPWAEDLEKVTATEAAVLLREADAAIKAGDQVRASAVVQRYGALGHPARGMFDLLLRYGVSEDGSLHAEKYYRTVTEEYARTRPAYRWQHVVALARVTASEAGRPAPGYAEACRLLGV